MWVYNLKAAGGGNNATKMFKYQENPVCFGTKHDFLPFDGGHVCPGGHAYDENPDHHC